MGKIFYGLLEYYYNGLGVGVTEGGGCIIPSTALQNKMANCMFISMAHYFELMVNVVNVL